MRPERVADPYTHSAHAKRCQVAGKERVVLRQFVQAKLGRTTFCARIAGAWDTSDGVEMWELQLLQPFPGISSVAAHRVRQCSGVDGCCSCAGEGAGGAAQPPAAPREAGVTC